MTDALTEPHATELAQRIINTMRPTPPLQDWVEELTGLSGQRAWTVFREFRTGTEEGLRIGTFMRVYRENLNAERRARTADEPPPVCQLCDGTGWTECTDHRRHANHCTNHDTCHCHAVQPCRCTPAEQARRIQASIDDA